MRKSVISAFAKNTPSRSGRRRAATLAATVLLAGSVQLLTTDTAWACGAPLGAPAGASAPKAAGPSAKAADTHRGTIDAGFFMTPGLTVLAGGPKVEIPVEVGNFTGAPYRKAVPSLSFFNENGGAPLRAEDLTVEVRSTGAWQKVPLVRGCDPVLYATAPKGEPVADGRAVHFTFRVGLAAKATADLDGIRVGLTADAEDGKHSPWVFKNMSVTHRTTPASPKPAPTTKPSSKPSSTAKPVPAKPAAAQTPAAPAAPAKAPAATPSAPATTAPAGTPELAQTGADTPNGFLAASAAAFVALGAGVLIAVRRLRPQR
ncbi:hypothetical protein [Kitasatospora sp. NPDC092286]|uniref:hypothetical protein n=1 Tax=Kitasatospora sp. NPDC092286 TaxID=3364087 RepID=UPI00380F7CCF